MHAEPSVWILSRGRKGDLDQMLALVRALGWPYQVKQLSFAGPEIPVLSKQLLRNGSEIFSGPFPDVVLCAEASPSVIAREIRRLSQGRTRAVCLGRPAGSAEGFDLVITTAQYRVPAAPNVVELAMPLAAETASLQVTTPDGPIALLVGGPAFPDLLDEDAAQRLAAGAMAEAVRRGKTLAAVTSPRTPAPAVAVLERSIVPPHSLSIFGRGENRYRRVLAEASAIIVTSDSISMLSDALAAGKPVAVYPLPQSRNLKLAAGEWLHRNAIESPKPGFGLVRRLFDAGLIEAAADRRRLIGRLVAEGRAAWFGADLPVPQPDAAARDLARAADSLRALVS
jgi:mitochondrial fission protein ELM1